MQKGFLELENCFETYGKIFISHGKTFIIVDESDRILGIERYLKQGPKAVKFVVNSVDSESIEKVETVLMRMLEVLQPITISFELTRYTELTYYEVVQMFERVVKELPESVEYLNVSNLDIFNLRAVPDRIQNISCESYSKAIKDKTGIIHLGAFSEIDLGEAELSCSGLVVVGDGKMAINAPNLRIASIQSERIVLKAPNLKSLKQNEGIVDIPDSVKNLWVGSECEAVKGGKNVKRLFCEDECEDLDLKMFPRLMWLRCEDESQNFGNDEKLRDFA